MSTSFKSFDEMLRAAIEDGVLPVPASWQAKSTLLNFQFNEWLKAERQVKLDTETGELLDYQQHLTASNFMAFLKEQEKLKQKAERDEKERKAARWQTKPEIESWADLFAVPNWPEYLDLLCNTDPPLLVKAAEQYLPANGVKPALIAGYFFRVLFEKKKLLTIKNRAELGAALMRLLPAFKISPAMVSHYEALEIAKKVKVLNTRPPNLTD